MCKWWKDEENEEKNEEMQMKKKISYKSTSHGYKEKLDEAFAKKWDFNHALHLSENMTELETYGENKL